MLVLLYSSHLPILGLVAILAACIIPQAMNNYLTHIGTYCGAVAW